MVDLSVGQVSGLIAFGVFVLQYFLPLAVPAILVAFISDTHTLVTWSVLGRFFQTSPWPVLLNSDTVAGAGVKMRVSVVSWLSFFALILVAVAAIVTPLGLYESIEPEDSTEDTPFRYIKDASAFGFGTPPRPQARFARSCMPDFVCPGETMTKSCETLGPVGFENCTAERDITVPGNYISPLRDGASKFSSSVSSIFDIQWRNYIDVALEGSKDVFLKPAFRQLDMLILDGGIRPLEGLIVDMETGGLGFRNHTIPKDHFVYGTSWTEDILFIEPETQCTDLNFTVDFRISNLGSQEFAVNPHLTDHGGFSGLRNYPTPNMTWTFTNGQDDPDLKKRATDAGWLNNFLTMVYFNATDPDMTDILRLDVSEGDVFDIPSFKNNTTFRVAYDVVKTNPNFGEYLNLTALPGVDGPGWSDNPFNVSSRNFSLISTICAGSSFNSPANINTTLVGCSLLYGGAKPTDPGVSHLIPSPGSAWTVPVYSCASTVKALVKEVTFEFNGTAFENLKIASLKPKAYSEAQPAPLWAVEDLGRMPISAGQPLWGILGSSNSKKDVTFASNMSTTSQPELYLPGFADADSIVLSGYQLEDIPLGLNLPGVDFFNRALLNALMISQPGTLGFRGLADYSGQTSLALFAKWQSLSETAEGAAKIINLVWTDVASNYVVGTKGWGLTSWSATAHDEEKDVSKRSTGGGNTPGDNPLVPVTVFKRRIRYEIPFAVPAFMTLGVTTVTLALLIVLAVMGKTGPRRMRMFVDASSPGRIIGMFLCPDKSKTGTGTKQWVKGVGMTVVTISKDDIKIADSSGSRAIGADEVDEETHIMTTLK